MPKLVIKMNRKDRRKLGGHIQSFGASYMTKEEINGVYEKGFKDGMREVSEIVFYMTAYTIDYKLDLTHEQKIELMKAVYNNIDGYRTGHLEPVDYDVIVKEMNDKGIKIE